VYRIEWFAHFNLATGIAAVICRRKDPYNWIVYFVELLQLLQLLQNVYYKNLALFHLLYRLYMFHWANPMTICPQPSDLLSPAQE
jgi:hypothetical protein